MSDMSAISAILSSVTTATDIIKLIRDTSSTLEKAELRLKLADVMNSLADARHDIIEIQDTITEKDKRIKELEEAFEMKSRLVRNWDAYYEISEGGKPTGDPYCMHCWESNHKAYHLHHNSLRSDIKDCAVCKTHYDARATQTIEK